MIFKNHVSWCACLLGLTLNAGCDDSAESPPSTHETLQHTPTRPLNPPGEISSVQFPELQVLSTLGSVPSDLSTENVRSRLEQVYKREIEAAHTAITSSNAAQVAAGLRANLLTAIEKLRTGGESSDVDSNSTRSN